MALHMLAICSTYRQDNPQAAVCCSLALILGTAAPAVSTMDMLSRSRGLHDHWSRVGCAVVSNDLREGLPAAPHVCAQQLLPVYHWYLAADGGCALCMSAFAFVQVNRLAQKTDAGQLSRNLLLVPKATVNVKPNLQIIADDVKCTHGCAVSDLSDEELFYFRARGVSYEQARQALVYSFGAEVVQQLKHEKLVARIQQDIRDSLKKTVQELDA